MVAATYPYRPDYAVPPGWVLEEHLKSHSLSPAELAWPADVAVPQN